MKRSFAAALAVASCLAWLAVSAAEPAAKLEQLEAEVAKAEEAHGAESLRLAEAIDSLATELESQSRLADAEPLRKRSLSIREKKLGSEHPQTATAFHDLAALYHSQARYAEAEPPYRRALEIREKSDGADSTAVADSLAKIGELYMDQSRHEEAGKAFVRSLAIREKSLGPQHRDVGEALNNLGKLYIFSGREGESEALYKRALAILRAAVPESYEVAMVLNNLAELYGFVGRDKEAEPLYKESLVLMEKVLHAEHPDVAVILSNLGRVYLHQGRDSEAEPPFIRSLAIREKVLGPKHPDVTNSLQDLAFLNEHRGRYNEAEPLLKRILMIREEALGPGNHDMGTALNALAVNFALQRRFAEAVALYKRSLEIFEKTIGADHSDFGAAANNLALAYAEMGQVAEVESLNKRSLAINEKRFGPEHAETAVSMNNLGEFYRTQGRLAEAEPLMLHSLEIREKVLGPLHPLVAQSLNNLAILHQSQGRGGEARARFRESVVLYERSLGSEHPSLAHSLYAFAEFEESQNRPADALVHSRRATPIKRARIIASSSDEGAARESSANRLGFYRHLKLLAVNPGKEPARRVNEESFEIAQLIQSTGTASAVAKMAARFATGDDELAVLVKRKHDVSERIRRKDADLTSTASRTPDKRNAGEERGLRAELAELDVELGKIDAELQSRFPNYQVLTRPEPLTVSAVQHLLLPQEALIAYSIAADGAWLWVVRRESAAFLPLATKRSSLIELVGRARAGMQPDSAGVLPNIDVRRLHELYRVAFAPAVPHLKGIKHVMVVPAGPLESLPFGTLIASPPRDIRTPADYRSIDWLAKRYALSVLPSVGSIRALREFARPVAARKPFAGFGDPQLTDDSGPARARNTAISPAMVFRNVRGASAARTDVADVAAIKAAPSLPETADELRAMARLLNADAGSLWLRARATERQVKQLDLSDYRLIAFATHGVTAGELSGIGEPGLLLTPPDEGTPEDDGYLSAGEIAKLKMNADWVLLSACNTAAADGTPGAEGLSGLAKAFFYAGSRSLFVSHWPVASEATVALTTAMLREYSANPAQGKAQAHRKAMLALMSTPGHPEYAHPFFWAPFVVVGEGGMGKR